MYESNLFELSKILFMSDFQIIPQIHKIPKLQSRSVFIRDWYQHFHVTIWTRKNLNGVM